jgi:hypothetical protein
MTSPSLSALVAGRHGASGTDAREPAIVRTRRLSSALQLLGFPLR